MNKLRILKVCCIGLALAASEQAHTQTQAPQNGAVPDSSSRSVAPDSPLGRVLSCTDTFNVVWEQTRRIYVIMNATAQAFVQQDTTPATLQATKEAVADFAEFLRVVQYYKEELYLLTYNRYVSVAEYEKALDIYRALLTSMQRDGAACSDFFQHYYVNRNYRKISGFANGVEGIKIARVMLNSISKDVFKLK
jgi:tetratricopeptide (TPR) repeat protein